MSRRVAIAALILAHASASAADPLDTVRALPVRVSRARLEQLGELLTLVTTAQQRPLAELVDATAEGMLLHAFLVSNAPRALLVDLTASAGGGVAAGGVSGDMTAVLSARLAGDYCDIASVSGSVRASHDAAAGSGVETHAQAGLCFWRGVYVPASAEIPVAGSLFPLRFDAELALDTAPRFASLRNEPRRRYSEALYSFAAEGLRIYPSQPDRGVTVIYMGFEQRWEWPGMFDGNRGFELAGGFGFVRLFRTRDALALADRAIDILDFRVHGTRFDESVALFDAYPVRLRGIGLLGDRVLLDADLGIAGSDGMISSSDCLNKQCVNEVIKTGDNVAKVSTWVAHGGIAAGSRLDGGGVAFVRRLDSNILGQLAVENRTTAWAQLARTWVTARGEVFGGNATHYLDVQARGRERFVGASLDLRYPLARGLSAGLELDGIRTFERDPILEGRVAGSGMRAFVTLSYAASLFHEDIDLDLPPSPITAPASSPPP